LGEKCVLSARRISNLAEFRQRFPEVTDVMLDGMERPSNTLKTTNVTAATTLARRRVIAAKTW
jgi:hypothetical protein